MVVGIILSPGGVLNQVPTRYTPRGPSFCRVAETQTDSSPRHRRVPPATCAPDAGKTGIHLTTPEQGPKITPQKLHVSVA